MQNSPKERSVCMNPTNIFLGVLTLSLMTLLLRWMRKLIPQITGVRSQRMCSACGLITSQKARCLECGVTTVSTR
jgi:hypothetical protein